MHFKASEAVYSLEMFNFCFRKAPVYCGLKAKVQQKSDFSDSASLT